MNTPDVTKDTIVGGIPGATLVMERAISKSHILFKGEERLAVVYDVEGQAGGCGFAAAIFPGDTDDMKVLEGTEPLEVLPFNNLTELDEWRSQVQPVLTGWQNARDYG